MQAQLILNFFIVVPNLIANHQQPIMRYSVLQ